MSVSQSHLDRALERLFERACSDSELARELQDSRREFFGELALHNAARDSDLAERRHREWFLLERPSAHLAAVPVEGLLGELAGSGTVEPAGLEALLASFSGVFEVTGVSAGEGVWVRDLAAHGEYPLEEVEGSHALECGDLLVGRVFPVGDSLYRISHAAGFFRNPQLLTALSRDLERARAQRRGVLRLQQSELESMFFTPRSKDLAITPEQQIEAARRALITGGVDAGDVDEILRELAESDFDPEIIIVPGADDVLGEILSRLAFETSVDLERARAALLAAWPVLAARKNGATEEVDEREQEPVFVRERSQRPESREVTDVRAAIESFDRGRREGRDLEALFAELERQLEIDAENEREADEAVVPDFPGVVGAMVDEFLWEQERECGTATAERYASLRRFSAFGASIGVFENLRERDLLLFTTIWLPEQGALTSNHEALRTLESLEAFCGWAETQHEVALKTALSGFLHGLKRSLPRVTEANLRLPGAGATRPSGGTVLEVTSVDESGVARARDGHAAEHELEIAPDASSYLRPGDRVRAEPVASGRWRVLCCYPPESARLALER